jgi:hypothetical protein
MPLRWLLTAMIDFTHSGVVWRLTESWICIAKHRFHIIFMEWLSILMSSDSLFPRNSSILLEGWVCVQRRFNTVVLLLRIVRLSDSDLVPSTILLGLLAMNIL